MKFKASVVSQILFGICIGILLGSVLSEKYPDGIIPCKYKVDVIKNIDDLTKSEITHISNIIDINTIDFQKDRLVKVYLNPMGIAPSMKKCQTIIENLPDINDPKEGIIYIGDDWESINKISSKIGIYGETEGGGTLYIINNGSNIVGIFKTNNI